MRLIRAALKQVTARRVFWAAVIVVVALLVLTTGGFPSWRDFWELSPTLAVFLAVVEGLILFFALLIVYVAARALIVTQAKPELDLVFNEDSKKEVTLEADRDNSLEASISAYMVNTGSAVAGYFTVELHVPRQLVDNEKTRAGGKWLFYADFMQEVYPSVPQGGDYLYKFMSETAFVPAQRWRKAAPGLWLFRIDLNRQLSSGVDECHDIGWEITAGKMGTREGQLTVRLRSKQPQTEVE